MYILKLYQFNSNQTQIISVRSCNSHREAGIGAPFVDQEDHSRAVTAALPMIRSVECSLSGTNSER
jgi:hypothetical protein